MPLKSLNALELGSYILSQKRESALTEFGVVEINTKSLKRYFKLKSTVWQGVMVNIMNNQLHDYTLQGGKTISNKALKNVFSDLLRLHGVEFGINNFRSLSKKGYSIIWQHQNTLVSLNVIISKSKNCSITLKKAYNPNKDKNRKMDENAIAILENYLGKGFHNLAPFQIANGDSKTNKELDNLLAN